MDMGHFLDVNLSENGDPIDVGIFSSVASVLVFVCMYNCHEFLFFQNVVTPRKSPTPVRSPTVKHYRDLPRQDAFCLSPASAKAVSKNLLRASQSPIKSTNGSPQRSIISSPSQLSPQRSIISSPTQLRVSSNAHGSPPQMESALRSRVDGRRKLFPVEQKSFGEFVS